MIDLSSQSADKTADPSQSSASPRHDLVAQAGVSGHELPSAGTYDVAEKGVQLFSRWAGPVALLGTLAILGWWLLS